MTNTILILIACSMVITSTVNFMKPWYKSKTGKRASTITIWLSFALGILASFSVAPYLGLELNTGLLILIWLGLGTWANLFYDIWDLVKQWAKSLKAEAEIWLEDDKK